MMVDVMVDCTSEKGDGRVGMERKESDRMGREDMRGRVVGRRLGPGIDDRMDRSERRGMIGEKLSVGMEDKKDDVTKRKQRNRLVKSKPCWVMTCTYTLHLSPSVVARLPNAVIFRAISVLRPKREMNDHKVVPDLLVHFPLLCLFIFSSTPSLSLHRFNPIKHNV